MAMVPRRFFSPLSASLRMGVRRFLLDQVRAVAAGQKALAFVDLVNDRLIVMTGPHIGEEVVDGQWGLVGIQSHGDITQRGLDQHDRVHGVGGRLCGQVLDSRRRQGLRRRAADGGRRRRSSHRRCGCSPPGPPAAPAQACDDRFPVMWHAWHLRRGSRFLGQRQVRYHPQNGLLLQRRLCANFRVAAWKLG